MVNQEKIDIMLFSIPQKENVTIKDINITVNPLCVRQNTDKKMRKAIRRLSEMLFNNIVINMQEKGINNE